MDLKNKNESLYAYIPHLDDDRSSIGSEGEGETQEEKEERLLDEQIRLYLNENLPPLLSPESLLSYYDYYKSKPKFVSLYLQRDRASAVGYPVQLSSAPQGTQTRLHLFPSSSKEWS